MSIAFGIAIPSAARADGSTCEPLTPAEFGSLVFAAQTAVEKADADLHRSLVLELQSRLPCLQFAPSHRQWANYLVLEALMEFIQGGDWRGPCTAARTLWPAVDLLVSERHPIAQCSASGDEPTMTEPAIADAYVDGVLTREVPRTGIHLVQYEHGGRWRTIVMRGEPVDQAVLFATFPDAPKWEWGAELGASVGVGGGVQRRVDWSMDPEAGEPVVPEDDWVVAWPELSARGAATRARLALAGHVEIALPALTGAQVSTAEAFAGYAFQRGMIIAAGPGVGVGTVIELDENDGASERRNVTMPYGAVTCEVRRARHDFGVVVGLGASTARLSLSAGLLQRTAGSHGSIRIGLATGLAGSRFEQPPVSDTQAGGEAWSVVWHAGLWVGAAPRGA
jgi:hypothetical protein